MNQDTFFNLLRSPLITAGVGAFLGAVFAFYVSQLNEKIKRNRKRWRDHINGMVFLERYLNEVSDILAGIRAHIRLVLGTVPNTDKEPQVVLSDPQALPRNPAHLASSLRMELFNELFSYDQKVRKLNNDILTICRSYSEVRSAALSGNLNAPQYLVRFKEYCKGMRVLEKACGLMDDRTMKLLAQTRATLKRDSIHGNSKFFILPDLEDISKEEIDQELGLLHVEIEQVRTESRDELDKYSL